MTLQEIFDAGLFGIRGQNYVPSYDSASSVCMYRGPNGRKCHIGHSIRDEDYRQSMEGSSADAGQVIQLFPSISEHALCEFQRIHDDVLDENDAKAYEKRMHQFAKHHKLLYTPVPK